MSAEPKHRARLRAFGHRDLGARAVGHRDLDLVAENRLHEADRYLADERRAVALEEAVLVIAHPQDDVEVSGRRRTHSRLALAGNPKLRPGVDTRGDLDLDLALLRHETLAATVAAGRRDDLAGSAAPTAGAGHREEALLERDLAGAVARAAGGGLAARGRTRPAARRALFVTRHADGLGGSEEAFLEVDLDGVAKVGPAPRPAAPSPSRVTEAEEVAEDVGEVREGGRIEAASSRGTGHAGVAVGVVALSLFGVGEHAVRLGRLLEPLLGRLVPGVAVRVVLHRDLPVRGLDLLVGARSRDLENFVVVASHGLEDVSLHSEESGLAAGEAGEHRLRTPKRGASRTKGSGRSLPSRAGNAEGSRWCRRSSGAGCP